MSRLYLTILFTLQLFGSDIVRAEELQGTIKRVIKQALPSVVVIIPDTPGQATFASGFVVNKQRRLILTSAHVMRTTEKCFVRLLGDAKQYSAKVIALDNDDDLALVQMEDATTLHHEIKFASQAVEQGDFVVALGNPAGYEFSASLGIVSGLDRQLADAPPSSRFLQVDNRITSGASGGPLFNAQSQVIGIISRGDPSGVATFAIPFERLIQFTNRALTAIR